jgi:hypothetical protein
MQTVRFTEVVKRSGKPEVYLLLSKDDKAFHDALRHDRILSLVGGADGAKTEYGVVGYDAHRRGQLLLFPRSLKAFVDTRVVGIKFELFSEPVGREPAREKPTKRSQPRLREARREKSSAPKPERPDNDAGREGKKVIPFLKSKPAPKVTRQLNLEQMRAKARQGLRALEKNNSVAAYKLLKELVVE